MHGLAVLLFPAVLMLFALAMEKMEQGVSHANRHRDEVDEFLADVPENIASTQDFPVVRVDPDGSGATVIIDVEPDDSPAPFRRAG